MMTKLDVLFELRGCITKLSERLFRYILQQEFEDLNSGLIVSRTGVYSIEISYDYYDFKYIMVECSKCNSHNGAYIELTNSKIDFPCCGCFND